jgi:hypothetical protein
MHCHADEIKTEIANPDSRAENALRAIQDLLAADLELQKR